MIYKDKLCLLGMVKLDLKLNVAGVIVFTQGVFDIINNGHTRYLREAKKYGGSLVVGLHSDDFAEERKGRRPVRSFFERAEMLSCFGFVDYIIGINNQQESYSSIKLLNPHLVIVSETTTDEANSPATINKLFSKYYDIKVLPPQSREHSSDYVKTFRK